ncbi:hypothetical protein KEM52_003580 [Ascosphaera acerosa]|nr:hypothetical protein KEM52_003580 [Ascosphaera acerosa]
MVRAAQLPAEHAEQHDGPTFNHPHATEIFNSIHAAMRQWDSSVLHNGMTFYFATVPTGTQFYHGGSTAARVTGLEWLAFEAEHALGFAWPADSPPPPVNDDDDKGRQQQQLETHSQKPMGAGPSSSAYGYLHTYVTNKDLRLLYLDGMAAAKSGIGTMDLENLILLNGTFPPGGRFQEYDKARAMCNIARNDWHGRINGFLRMEAGFEIILCSFDDDVDVVRITATRRPKPDDKRFHDEMNLQYMQALASRYDGVGKDVVRLDFGRFVSAFDYDIDLYPDPTDRARPRLLNASANAIARMRDDLWTLARREGTPSLAVDWQAASDRVVLRYADVIESLAAGSEATAFFERLEAVLMPFIDYEQLESAGVAAEPGLTVQRCAQQFIPHSARDDGLAHKAIYGTAHRICSTCASLLFDHWSTTRPMEEQLASGVRRMRALKEALAWPAWKRCRGCGPDQYCMIPMWPLGDKADYDHPRCRGGSAFNWWGDYWGPMTD